MAKRKYIRYTLIAEDGTIEEFYGYQEAFREYNRCNAPKTLYGYDKQDNGSVIFSKG